MDEEQMALLEAWEPNRTEACARRTTMDGCDAKGSVGCKWTPGLVRVGKCTPDKEAQRAWKQAYLAVVQTPLSPFTKQDAQLLAAFPFGAHLIDMLIRKTELEAVEANLGRLTDLPGDSQALLFMAMYPLLQYEASDPWAGDIKALYDIAVKREPFGSRSKAIQEYHAKRRATDAPTGIGRRGFGWVAAAALLAFLVAAAPVASREIMDWGTVDYELEWRQKLEAERDQEAKQELEAQRNLEVQQHWEVQQHLEAVERNLNYLKPHFQNLDQYLTAGEVEDDLASLFDGLPEEQRWDAVDKMAHVLGRPGGDIALDFAPGGEISLDFAPGNLVVLKEKGQDLAKYQMPWTGSTSDWLAIHQGEKIGEGSFGAVYEDKLNEGRVIKVIRPHRIVEYGPWAKVFDYEVDVGRYMATIGVGPRVFQAFRSDRDSEGVIVMEKFDSSLDEASEGHCPQWLDKVQQLSVSDKMCFDIKELNAVTRGQGDKTEVRLIDFGNMCGDLDGSVKEVAQAKQLLMTYLIAYSRSTRFCKSPAFDIIETLEGIPDVARRAQSILKDDASMADTFASLFIRYSGYPAKLVTDHLCFAARDCSLDPPDRIREAAMAGFTPASPV